MIFIIDIIDFVEISKMNDVIKRNYEFHKTED